MHLSRNCESKIRTACQQFPKREWSGAAFYNITYLNGKDKESATLLDIRIDILDFCLQDIGSSTYTEYDLDATVASYIADHMDTLMGAKVALLHSHNSMNAFFSGTDLDTLKEQASQCNNVLSIVVNNDGNYVAKFTQKEIVHQVDDITTDSVVTSSYSLLGEVNKSSQEVSHDFKSNVSDYHNIKVYDCDIFRPLDVPIDKDFQQECIELEEKLASKREVKYPSVEEVILKNTDRHPFSGWLFNDYTETKDKHNPNPQHDIDLLARSILFLSLDIKSLKAQRHIEDVPLYHVSEDVIYSFLEAWFCYFFPNSMCLEEDNFSVEELGQIQTALMRYFNCAGKTSHEGEIIQHGVLDTIENYKLYFMA